MFVSLYIILLAITIIILLICFVLLVIIMGNALNDLNNYDGTNIKRDNRRRI